MPAIKAANKQDSQLHNLVEQLSKIKAKDIMTTNVISIKENASLTEVAQLMIEKKISGMPVLNDKGDIKGVITSPDLFMVMDMIRSGDTLPGKWGSLLNPSVSFAMSTNVETVQLNTNLEEIISLMKYKNITTLPVLEKDKLTGIIGRRDVYKAFYLSLCYISETT